MLDVGRWMFASSFKEARGAAVGQAEAEPAPSDSRLEQVWASVLDLAQVLALYLPAPHHFNKKPGSNFRSGFLNYYPAGAVQAILPFPFVKGG